MTTPVTPTDEIPVTAELPKTQNTESKPAPEAWEEFLEDDADCCGGCHHKPR